MKKTAKIAAAAALGLGLVMMGAEAAKLIA